MTRTARPIETDQATAAEAGFPVAVRVPFDDGPLTFTDPHAETTETYTVEGGRATASTRARLDTLVRAGGVPLITPPEGQGSTPPDGGTAG